MPIYVLRVLDIFIFGDDDAYVDEWDDEDLNENELLLPEATDDELLGVGGILLSPLRHASTCSWITLTSICFQQTGHSAMDGLSASADVIA